MLFPKWSALWKMTIGHKNACEMQSVFEISVNFFGYRANSPSDDKNTNRFRRSAMSVHSTVAFHQYDRIGGYKDRSAQFYFAEVCPIFFAERRGLFWFSCWKSHHENAEKSTPYERLSRAVYRFFAHLRISTTCWNDIYYVVSTLG